MKNLAILFLIALFSHGATAQKPKTKPVKKAAAATTAKTSADEKTELEKAAATENAEERIAALQKFIKDFPKSKEKTGALELIVSARAAIADEKLRAGEIESGVKLFNLAVREAPKPVPDKLFTEIVLQIPTNLFFRNQQSAAVEAAKTIEEKIEGNAKQTLALATFYLGTENAAEAKRLAEKALAIEPGSPAAYQTLGIAHRLNFQLEEAAAAYAKALELDIDSVVSQRSLAEMKRALGKTDEAIALYRAILAKNPSDVPAQTGLTLSLFGAEKRVEAEAEMQKSLEQAPNNLPLLVGAAYWYAAHEQGAKAVEFAEKAIAIEPRYTWAHIALARGLILERRPLEAERTLLSARQYGNFPTLDYEIASARFQAGFFREAADQLKKTFAVKSDSIETRLGGRVPAEAKNFTDLLSLERRAAIFEFAAADNAETAQKLKSLLDFSQKLDAAETNETAVTEAADEFVKGDDKMKLHRQLYAANRLLEKRTAFPKVLELAKSAISELDSSFDVANPSAAVLADELYQSRTLAMTRGELVIVPNVQRQTLVNILRGRIEDISGWALFQENKSGEAVVRLKRAVSVLPEKSAWWRASLWHLGAALDADGKSNEALEAYIKSYTNNPEPDLAKRIIIEALYQKVNGNTEGLEQKIGAKLQPENNLLNRQAEKADANAQTPVKENETSIPTTLANEAKPETTPEITSPVKEPPALPEETKPSLETKSEPETTTDSSDAKDKEPTEAKTKEAQTETGKSEKDPNETPVPPPVEAVIKQTGKSENQTIENQTPEKVPTEKETAEKSLVENRVAEKPSVDKAPVDKVPTVKVFIEDGLKEKAPTEKAATEKATTEKKTDEKALFDPVIINVSKAEEEKKNEKPLPEVNTEPAAKPTEINKTEPGATRERIVAEKKIETETNVSAESKDACKISVSQEAISILSGGGSLGVLIGLEGKTDPGEITALSSNPGDLEVTRQIETTGVSNSAFFVIKSISQKKGEYFVRFELPCGKKEISVNVR